MPQLRQDRFTKEWVFVASEDIRRPQELIVLRDRKPVASFHPDCPFCPGNESRTGPEILRIPSAKSGWTIRVIPRTFTGFEIESANEEANDASPAKGFGIHELVVEAADHSLTTALLPELHLISLLRTAKARYDEVCVDSRIGYATLRKRHTAEGTDHSSLHVVGTHVIPQGVTERLCQARHHYGQRGTCIFCVVLQEELVEQSRIVATSQHFIAFEPFASPSPFCTQIYPRRHMANFGEITAEELADFSRILRDVLGKFYFGLGNPNFTFSIRSSPVAHAGVNYYHWGLNLVPELPPVSGLEQHGKMFLNPVLPEDAAQFLREVRVEQAIPA